MITQHPSRLASLPPPSAPDHIPKPPPITNKPRIVKRGALEFRIYKQTRLVNTARGPRRYTAHVLAYRLNRRRVRIVRAALDDLLPEIEAAETAIANGQTDLLNFNNTDRALLQRLRQLASGCEAPLELLVSEAVAARRLAASRAKIVPKPCPKIVAELLEQKRKEGRCGAKWLRSLESMLTRFARHWPAPLHTLRAPELNSWLRSLPGGLIYRRHHLGAAKELISFAKGRNYIAREWEEFRHVDNPEPPPVKIIIWSPDQLRKLLAATHPNMIPFTACMAFAGIRHEELNPEECEVDKQPLDWRHIDFEQKHIEITSDTGKTGARIVPMSENLIAWLKPHRQPAGRVCALSNTSNALTRAKARAGLPTGKNTSRNVLRKSFGSYRLAVVKHIGQVADEMGNSPEKIKTNYRKPRPEREGKAWFDIWPSNAEFRQIKLPL